MRFERWETCSPRHGRTRWAAWLAILVLAGCGRIGDGVVPTDLGAGADASGELAGDGPANTGDEPPPMDAARDAGLDTRETPDTSFADTADVTTDPALDLPGDLVDVRDTGPEDVVDAGPITAPRPVAPLSLGDVTLLRPTLRWELSAGVDGAVVELCRDRACTMVLETLPVTGTSARPTMPLPARSVVFWRLRGRRGTTAGTDVSPTWLFHVPARDASSGVDTSFNPHLDVNGDGYDDLVVGAYWADPGGRMKAGTASVYHGTATGVGTTPARVLEGGPVEDTFGVSVASAGDVNGDGYADLVVGAIGADRSGQFNEGTASVFHGSATGLGMTPARVLEGPRAGDFFGSRVASAGDVNGDGYADLVVGAYGADPGGRLDAGTASVFHGSATGVGMTPPRVFEGATAGDNFGTSVASAGDVNGDGYADLVVGAQSAGPGGRLNAGTASVFHGSAMGVGMTPTRVLEGAAMDDRFGGSVASAGDVNGDGYADLVVGALGADLGGRSNNAGTASVFHGSATGLGMTPARVLEGGAANDLFGTSVASAGDVNGDGYADLVVGAKEANPGGRRAAFLG